MLRGERELPLSSFSFLDYLYVFGSRLREGASVPGIRINLETRVKEDLLPVDFANDFCDVIAVRGKILHVFFSKRMAVFNPVDERYVTAVDLHSR